MAFRHRQTFPVANYSLDCYSRQLKREENVKDREAEGLSDLASGPKLDLSFKEGQTIKINIAVSECNSIIGFSSSVTWL